MVVAIIFSALTIVGILLTSLLCPSIEFGKKHQIHLNLYWMIALVGALAILLTGTLSFKDWWSGLTASNGINPIQILLLFLSMSFLSIYLDELGFFAHLAKWALERVKRGQVALFSVLYIFVSILTMFTSNDIIILTLTPFILFFCKNAKISPIPYLVSEFIAANTWSMIFIIGNPTNIYLASSFNINFVDYFKVMAVPTLLTGVVEFIILLLLFRKKLQTPLEHPEVHLEEENKPLIVIGLVILIACTIMLVVSNYVNIPMYLVSVIAVGLLVVSTGIYYLVKKQKPVEIVTSFKRAPWEIIPFIIGMFTLVLALSSHGVTSKIASIFPSKMVTLTFGYSSLLVANFMNNIPMSVLYTSICSNVAPSMQSAAVYSSIVGSNIGAFISPLGALAGIMWLSILKKHEVKYSFLDFLKYGVIVGIPSITVTLFSLMLFI